MIEPMIGAVPRWFLGILLLAAGLSAFQENGAMLGRVLDITGGPLRSARIRMYRSDADNQYEQYTDSAGRFGITDVPAGAYRVTVSLQGFLDKTISEVKIAQGKPTELGNLRLDLAPCNTPGGPICDEIQPSRSRAKRPESTSAVPVLTVCDVLGDLASYNGTLIIVVGRFSFTDEGSWRDQECGLKLVINGRSFTNNISTTYDAEDVAPAPQKPKGFKWDRVSVASKLRAVKSTTQLRVLKQYHYTDQWMAILGRLEADLPWSKTIGQRHVLIDGFGHLNGSPAQLIPARDGSLRLDSK